MRIVAALPGCAGRCLRPQIVPRCYTEPVRRLIVNADDFGLTAGVNRAIAEAHERGVVTSATLMANAAAFEQALTMAHSLAERNAHFGVGCHVVLLDGAPISPPDQVRSLLEPGAINGVARFRDDLSGFAVSVLRGTLKGDEIETEALAQFERIQSAGIALSHFDAHKHAHMFPAVLRPLLRAASKKGIKAVRNPFGRVFPLPFSRMLGDFKLWKRFAEMSVLRNFARHFRTEVEKYGIRTTDGSLGVLVTGVLDLDLFTLIADGIPEGTWEFVCHPGYNDAELSKVRTRLRESRVREFEVLTSPEARSALERRGIELITFHEL